MVSDSDISRGAQTREALIDAAIEVFGHAGFDAASTRAISRKADVNQALIGYHFGGKQGLYLAAFESIAGQMGEIILPTALEVMETIEGVDLNTPRHKEISIECMETLLSAMLGMFGRPRASNWVRLVIREQQDPTSAFQILWDSFMEKMLGLMNRLVGLALDADPTAESTRIRALLVLSQVLFVFTARSTTSRQMDWKQLGQKELDLIREQLFINLHAQFNGAAKA